MSVKRKFIVLLCKIFTHFFFLQNLSLDIGGIKIINFALNYILISRNILNIYLT